MTKQPIADEQDGVSGEAWPETSSSVVRDFMWSDHVLSRGCAVIPSILLWGQNGLKLKPDELLVLLHLISEWNSPGELPDLAKKTIAARTGLGVRMVQRHLTALEQKGFLVRVARFKSHKGQDSNGYDLSGLVAKLEAITGQFEAAGEREARIRGVRMAARAP